MNAARNVPSSFQYPSVSLETEESRKNVLSEYPISESIAHLGTYVIQDHSLQRNTRLKSLM